jgi:methionyl-tRNA formyltransferase|tara:strand:- start:404 stop:1423 length:1020 start_codon:yes stop_codon:yes gene_type:complete
MKNKLFLKNKSAVFIGGTLMLDHCLKLVSKKFKKISIISHDKKILKKYKKKFNIIKINDLHNLSFDYLFSVLNEKIIPKEILKNIKILGINFHDGPLPKYAGLYSSSWAIINKEKKHGVCWHKIEKGVDTENIIAESKFSIKNFNTAYDIDVKGVLLGIKLFNKIIKQLNNDKIKFKKQNLSLRSYYGAKHLKKFYKKYKSFDKNSNIIRAFKLSAEKEKQLIKILKIKTQKINFTKDNQNNFEKHYSSKQYKKKLFEVFKIVKKVFRNKANLPSNKRKKFSYIENFGLGNHSAWDSLEHIKFLFNVEKKFKIKINETNGSNFNNVGSIARYLIKTQPF